MAPSLDVCFAVGALAITNRHVADFKVQMIRPENQIEIAEGIEVAEVGPVRRDAHVIVLKKNLGPAKRVLQRLA